MFVISGGEWEKISLKRDVDFDDISIPRGTVKFMFRPEKDYFGNFTVEIFGWTGSTPIRKKDRSVESVRLLVIVSVL